MAIEKMPLALIEPDEAVRTALKTLLEDRGWKVVSLENGKSLAEMLVKAGLFAVICESSLPDLSATNVLDQCRAHEVPVVFLGHRTEVQNAVDLVRMGAEDFLEKPFPQARLLKLLDSLEKA